MASSTAGTEKRLKGSGPRHILLADDGSKAVARARAFAVALAASNEAALTVVYVRNPEETTEKARAKIAATLDAAAAEGLSCKSLFALPVGITNPGRRVLAAAGTCGADLIVVGARGSGNVRKLLGSVSSYVVTHAAVSVCVIR